LLKGRASAFEVELGSDYDIVLIPAFLHHLDAATNEKRLRRVHAALAPAGMVITIEQIRNEDRVSPARDAPLSVSQRGLHAERVPGTPAVAHRRIPKVGSGQTAEKPFTD
jgi:hypothetical protein